MGSHPRRWLVILLLCCLSLIANSALGQSLSISKKGENDYWLRTSTPPGSQYVLQASANLHFWLDVNVEVSGLVSNRLDLPRFGQRFLRLAPASPPPDPIRLVLLGDSTVMDGPGWATALPEYVKPQLQVINLAFPNYTTRIFLASEQKPQLLAIKPHVVLVQFGWVDWGGCGGTPDHCGTTLQEYTDNLRAIVQLIRGFNGTPVLVTPLDPRYFDEQGKILRLLKDNVAAMKSLAAELQLDLVDFNQMAHDLYDSLGESGNAYLFREGDRVHFTPVGQQVLTELLISALPDRLGPYLLGKLNPPPKP